MMWTSSSDLLRQLLLDPFSALSDRDDPKWCGTGCGIDERHVRLVVGEVLVDPPKSFLGDVNRVYLVLGAQVSAATMLAQPGA